MTTCKPSSASVIAVARPTGPAPTIKTWASVGRDIFLRYAQKEGKDDALHPLPFFFRDGLGDHSPSFKLHGLLMSLGIGILSLRCYFCPRTNPLLFHPHCICATWSPYFSHIILTIVSHQYTISAHVICFMCPNFCYIVNHSSKCYTL